MAKKKNTSQDPETVFLKKLEKNPSDDETRAVYADFLEERGEVHKANCLRAEILKRSTNKVPSDWLMQVTSKRAALELEYDDAKLRINAQLGEAICLLRDADDLRLANGIVEGAEFENIDELSALVENFVEANWQSSRGTC